MATRPVLNRSEEKATVSAAMPKIDFKALEQTNGSCVPSNCDMFTPGDMKRPVIVREKAKVAA